MKKDAILTVGLVNILAGVFSAGGKSRAYFSTGIATKAAARRKYRNPIMRNPTFAGHSEQDISLHSSARPVRLLESTRQTGDEGLARHT